MLKRLEHLGIACRDLEQSVRTWRDLLGLELEGIEEIPAQKVRVAFLRAGEARIELLEPTDDDSPIARFIESRGEGFHHIAFRVQDLERMLEILADRGIRLVEKEPREGAHGAEVAFIHPKAVGGTLIELCQPSVESEDRRGEHRNPFPTVDIVINVSPAPAEPRVVLVRRRNPPYGWAIPGGFVDYGETVESAAVREAREETGLDVRLTGLLGVYSSPDRDPRFHTISTVFTANASGDPSAGDDAAETGVFAESSLPRDLAFDHARILEDYFRTRARNG